jgi:hypothetical protein
MARANRYDLPGRVWHLTHRCHQRVFPRAWSEREKGLRMLA